MDDKEFDEHDRSTFHSTRKTQSTRFLLGLGLGAFCISYAPLFVKWVHLPHATVAFFRCAIAVLVLAPILVVRGGFKYTFPLRWAVAAGLAFSLDLVFWHYSIAQVGAGLGTLLANAQVFFLAFIGYRMAGERVTRRYWMFLLLAVAGVFLLVSPGIYWSFSSDYLKGVLAGIFTGLFYSFFIIYLRKMATTETDRLPFTSLFYAMTSCSIILAVVVTAFGDWVSISTQQWIGLVGLAFICQVIGWILISASLPKVPVAFAGLLLLIQPVSSVIQAHFFFNENLGLIQILGATLVLFSVYRGSLEKPGS